MPEVTTKYYPPTHEAFLLSCIPFRYSVATSSPFDERPACRGLVFKDMASGGSRLDPSLQLASGVL